MCISTDTIIAILFTLFVVVVGTYGWYTIFEYIFEDIKR